MVSIPRIMYNILYPGNSTQFLTVSKLTQPYFKEIFKKLELELEMNLCIEKLRYSLNDKLQMK